MTVWITTNCEKFLKGWEYQTTWPAFWEIYIWVKKQQLKLDMEQQTDSKLGKVFIKGFILSPCLFNLCVDIVQNARLEEAQARIETARSINNLRYADDTTLRAEIEEELKSLLMKVEDES